MIATPPVIGGAILGFEARRRWTIYERDIEADRPLPVGRGISAVGIALCVYAVVALVATVLDG